MEDKLPLKGAWSRSRDALKILRLPVISLDWRKLDLSSYVYR